jgi:hypothetical protein
MVRSMVKPEREEAAGGWGNCIMRGCIMCSFLHTHIHTYIHTYMLKKFYNVESLYKFIQRTCTVF